MSLAKINSAMTKAYTDEFSLDTAYEGLDFDPPDGEWAQVSFIPVYDLVSSLGVGGLDESKGIMQIDFNQPKNNGDKKLLEYADQVRNKFVAGRRFAYEGQNVLIESAERSQIFTVDSKWNRIILSITYSSHSVRPEV